MTRYSQCLPVHPDALNASYASSSLVSNIGSISTCPSRAACSHPTSSLPLTTAPTCPQRTLAIVFARSSLIAPHSSRPHLARAACPHEHDALSVSHHCTHVRSRMAPRRVSTTRAYCAPVPLRSPRPSISPRSLSTLRVQRAYTSTLRHSHQYLPLHTVRAYALNALRRVSTRAHCAPPLIAFSPLVSIPNPNSISTCTSRAACSHEHDTLGVSHCTHVRSTHLDACVNARALRTAH